jgi:hypothetical protein
MDIAMKKSVLVVGSHLVGKSTTINEHLKPLLKISPHAHIFELNGKMGFVISQSSEESHKDVEALIHKYSDYDLFVLASRPEYETESNFEAAKEALKKASYDVNVVKVASLDEAPEKANEVFEILNSN